MSSMTTSTSTLKTLAVFPGQGSQFVGMGKDIFETFSVARECFEEASDAIKLNLKALCFDGPESELTLTENTQPCLLVTSVATFRALKKETGFTPDGFAGHSLGEYSALVAADALPLSIATAWVKERGKAMQAGVAPGQGKMAAIMGLEDGVVEKLCGAATERAQLGRKNDSGQNWSVECVVEPANFNSPGQVVVAGSADAVDQVLELIKGGGDFSGGKAVLLNVSAPFHCKLMKPARDKMHEIFAKNPGVVKPFAAPLIPNRTGRLHAEPGIALKLLEEQVDHPVLWKQSIEHALSNGFGRFVEIGPNKVLTGLIKRIAQKLGTNPSPTLMNVSDPASLALFAKPGPQ